MLGFLVALHVIFSVFLVLVILMQQSQGAGMSSVFGGGTGGGSFFGGRGASILLRKVTVVLAILFFLTSTTIAIRVPREAKVDREGIEEKLRQNLPERTGVPFEQGITEDVTPEGVTPDENAIPVESAIPEGSN